MTAPTGDRPNNDMLYEVADNIATITFNRPEQQNTISREMLARFTELLIEADADEAVRAIVITGTGKFFCAGLDLRGSDITDGLSDRTRRVSPTLDLRNTPPTVLPVKIISLAFAQPMSRGKIHVPPDSGTMPRAVNAAASLAVSAIMRMSQPRAMSMP